VPQDVVRSDAKEFRVVAEIAQAPVAEQAQQIAVSTRPVIMISVQAAGRPHAIRLRRASANLAQAALRIPLRVVFLDRPARPLQVLPAILLLDAQLALLWR
jgi:hypothetical protein